MFDIEFKRIKPIEIIHKLSDTNNAVVFSIKAMLDGEEIKCYLKILKLFRHNNEIELLTQKHPFSSGLIEYDKPQRYIVYEEAPGEGYLYTSPDKKSEVIRSSATMLKNIHHVNFDKQSRRNVKVEAEKESIKKAKLCERLPCIAEYVDKYEDVGGDYSFIHGDYHVFNLMFDENSRVISVIDWEFCGLYYKEYDIAYAVAPRRNLYSTLEDVKLFLEAYGEPFNRERFLYFYYATACYTFRGRERCSDEDFLKVVSDVGAFIRSGE